MTQRYYIAMHIITFSFVDDSANSSLSSKPRLYELDRISGNGKTVKVINRAACEWKKVATRLYFEGHDISTIHMDEHRAEDACRTMFIEWLEGKGRTPTSWETVIKALEEAELAEIAKDLRDIITS